MWKIRTLKIESKKAMKRNYTACLIVSLIMVFLVSGALTITKSIDTTTDYIIQLGQATNSQAIEEFGKDLVDVENNFREATSIGNDSSEGVISGLYYSTKSTGTVAGGFLMVFDKIFLKDSISAAVITALGTIVMILFLIFVENILRIGAARFFTESQLNGETPVSRILLIFRLKKVRHCAWIMFMRLIFNGLWFLTIVGGFIKLYSYRMIPYILAENPDITRKEAFDLSMKMMRGNKWKAFLMDVTFVPWWILSILTFGIVRYLWLEPYLKSAYAELYLTVRAGAIEAPLEMVPEPDGKKLTYDYHRKYSFVNLILLFFAFAMFGWIWECTLQAIIDGHFVNRGSLYGPWIPIYGFGGLGLVVLLRKFVDRPLLTFFLAMVVCGVIEGVTGWFLDVVRGMKYWDYSNFYFNIGGYVCLESLLVFGLGGCMFLYLFAPMLDTYFNKIPKKGRIGMCIVLVTAFLGDVVYSHFNPHVGDGIGGYDDSSSGGE